MVMEGESCLPGARGTKLKWTLYGVYLCIVVSSLGI